MRKVPRPPPCKSADADNFGYHMSLVEDHVRVAHEYLDYLHNARGILGSPTAEILDEMRAKYMILGSFASTMSTALSRSSPSRPRTRC